MNLNLCSLFLLCKSLTQYKQRKMYYVRIKFSGEREGNKGSKEKDDVDFPTVKKEPACVFYGISSHHSN